jgi:hypothetical protein
VLREPRCRLDDYTADVLSRFPSVHELLGPEACAERAAILVVAQPCTTRLEPRHAPVRRLCNVLYLHAPAADLESVSAMCVATAMRHRRREREGTKAHSAAKCPGKRTVNSWHVFLAHHAPQRFAAAGSSSKKIPPGLFGQVAQELAAEFQALSLQEKARYHRSATRANSTVDGSPPPWGLRGRALARHITNLQAKDDAASLAELGRPLHARAFGAPRQPDRRAEAPLRCMSMGSPCSASSRGRCLRTTSELRCRCSFGTQVFGAAEWKASQTIIRSVS